MHEEEADFLNTPHTSHTHTHSYSMSVSLVIEDEDDDDNDDDNDNQTHEQKTIGHEKQNKKGRLQSAIFFRLR